MTDRPERFELARPCPKCGVGPTPSICCTRTGPWMYEAARHEWIPEPHLHRKCLHCGHERIELALDAPEMSDEERKEWLEGELADFRKAVKEYSESRPAPMEVVPSRRKARWWQV